LATSAAFFGGLPAVFTASIIEGGTMHHTTDLTNSDRADVAQKHHDVEILEERRWRTS
jgi:hypothetical protein